MDYSFIKKYLDPKGRNYECITKFVAVNESKVTKDREKIIEYLLDNFNISNATTNVTDLLTDEFGNVINKLEDLSDLDNLEEVISLCLATGLFKDDFRVRFELFDKIGTVGKIFDRTAFKMPTKEDERKYVTTLRNRILEYQYFLTNHEIIKSYEEKKNVKKGKVYSDNEIKELLYFWLTECCSFELHNYELELYDFLVNNRYEEMYNLLAYLRMQGLTPDTFTMEYYRDSTLKIITEVNKTISNLPKEKRDYFEEVKKVFIDEIDKIRQSTKGRSK